jgi:hypothetical protein
MICEFCEKTFKKKFNFDNHKKTSLICIKFENTLKELEELKKEKKLPIITKNDLFENKLTNLDLVSYGDSIADFIINKTNIKDKIRLIDYTRKIINYNIDTKIYQNRGYHLIMFCIKHLKNNICELINNTYKDNQFPNEHTKRMINIATIELNEINQESILFKEISHKLHLLLFLL